MPKVEFHLSDLESLLGMKIPEDELEDILIYAKAELEHYDGDLVKCEIKDTNRPDLWSVEGIARELKGRLGIKTGLPEYRIFDSKIEVVVEGEPARPVIACGVVYDVKLGEHGFESLILLQEKVSQHFGRGRKEVAIGTHNLDLIKPPVYYKSYTPREIKFPPLGYDEEMYLDEILEKHPKGQEYGHLLDGYDKYPIIHDSKGEVFSFPPIINSNTIGNINKNTKNIFVDVTGYSESFVKTALNVILTALAERGGQIGFVRIIRDNKGEVSPDLKPRRCEFSYEYIRKLSGLELSDIEIKKLLERSRFNVEKNEILYLPYRRDIMHERDILEDILISYGYNNIEPRSLNLYTPGGLDELTLFVRKLRKYLVGTGAQEVRTYVLTDPEIFRKAELNLELTRVKNPVSRLYSVFRPMLIPSLLEFLSKNTSKEYPQRIFEIGECIIGSSTVYKLGYLVADRDISVTDVLEILRALLEDFGHEYTIKPENKEMFIPGRSGCVGDFGIFGEIHPRILESFGIHMPVVGFELDVEKLIR